MRHLITSVDTSIKNRELCVSFKIENEWDPFIQISFASIVKSIGEISIFELDILEGCYLQIDSFYKRGDKLPNGKIVHDENIIPKTGKIDCEGTLDELRIKRNSILPTFQTIYSVEVSQKNSKEPYVIVRTTDDKVYFDKVDSLKSLTRLNEYEFNLLTGVFIAPIMYKKGETSEYNGRFNTIKQDDKIVATFNIRFEGTIDNHFKLHGNPELKNSKHRANQNEGDSVRPIYEKYNGYNGWNDDIIDSAFNGDPEATWNVD